MTPDGMWARCKLARTDIAGLEDTPLSQWQKECMAILESLCHEMIAVGLERAAAIAGDAADDYVELGSPQACAASEQIEETCRAEAQKLKEPHD